MDDDEGLTGIEVDGFDEGDFTVDDVTNQLGDDDDLNTLTINEGISEEVMLVNNVGDLDIDDGDIGQNSKTVYINERVIEKTPIRTKYGTIWCDGRCEVCPYIAICTKTMDNFINGLDDMSQLPRRFGRPRTDAERSIIHEKIFGKNLLLPPRGTGMYRSYYLGATGKPKCKAGYKLMRKKSTGKLVCVRQKTTRVPSQKRKKRSPFSPFFIFPKHKSDPWKRSGASIGNFLFAVAVIGGLALVAPHVMKVAERGVDYGLSTWKKSREIRQIGKR